MIDNYRAGEDEREDKVVYCCDQCDSEIWGNDDAIVVNCSEVYCCQDCLFEALDCKYVEGNEVKNFIS